MHYCIQQTNLPEAYMEPSEYILHAKKKYKRVTTWIDITSVHQNEKSTQTTSHKPKVKNFNCTTRSKNSKVDTKIVLQSSSPFQLLDYDEDGRPNDEAVKTPNRPVEASEGFSLERENMRMVQLLNNLCNSQMDHLS